jgi:transmembrane sensor
MNGSRNELSAPSEKVMREAQCWVVRLHSGEADETELANLARWRNESVAHEQALAGAQYRWQLFREAALNIAAREGMACARPANRRLPQLGRRALFGGALAASAGITVGIVHPPSDLWPSLTELTADYRTKTGEHRQLTLASTVSVEMNTQTSLSVQRALPGVASIDLISGEVAVVATSPFVANAGGGHARVVQGSFDLRNDAGAVSVTCLAGQVQVTCGERVVVLQPTQLVAYDDRRLGAVSGANMDTVDAWRRGLLVFEETPLVRVIAEVNRYRRGRIILVNGALASLPVDATFRLDDLDKAIPKLEDVYGIKARALPGGIVLLS